MLFLAQQAVAGAMCNRRTSWPANTPACPAVEAKNSGPAEVPAAAVVTRKQKNCYATNPAPQSASPIGTPEETEPSHDQRLGEIAAEGPTSPQVGSDVDMVGRVGLEPTAKGL